MQIQHMLPHRGDFRRVAAYFTTINMVTYLEYPDVSHWSNRDNACRKLLQRSGTT
jgi:hypothetical protein